MTVKKLSQYCLYVLSNLSSVYSESKQIKTDFYSPDLKNPPGIHHSEKFKEIFCFYSHLKPFYFLEHIYETFF